MVRREAPQGLAVRSVHGHQFTAFRAEDHEARYRGQRAAPRLRRTGLRQFPFHRAGVDVQSLEYPFRFWIWPGALGTAQISLARRPRTRLGLLINTALLKSLKIVHARGGNVRGREPVGGAILRRTYLGARGRDRKS